MSEKTTEAKLKDLLVEFQHRASGTAWLAAEKDKKEEPHLLAEASNIFKEGTGDFDRGRAMGMGEAYSDAADMLEAIISPRTAVEGEEDLAK